ncbi:hypothetical protein ACTFIU_009259 [Dictyostelium citrinum]
MNDPIIKVFKNKYLFNKILQLIKDENKSKHNRYSYQDIISVEWMIQNKYISLLKSKVKKSEYLFFFKQIGNPSALELIFKHNELNNDLDFLVELFNNYKDYFLPSSNECIELLIKCDCLAGFKLIFQTNLLKDYKESLVNENDKIITTTTIADQQKQPEQQEKKQIKLLYKLFKLSINNNSFKISKFINDQYNITSQNDFNSDNFWKEILIEYKEQISDTIEQTRILLINSSVDFILNELKLSPPIKEIPELLNWLYAIEIKDINLRQLLHSNYTILKIKNVFNQSEIEKKSKINIVSNFSLLSLKDLDQMIFNERDLETSIKLFNSNEYDGSIRKLFLNLIPFTEEMNEISFFSSLSLRVNFYKENISFYFKKYQSKFSQFSNDHHHNNDNNNNNNNNQSKALLIEDVFIWQDSLSLPFRNFKYDKLLQFQYISVVVKEIINNPSNPKNFTTEQFLNELIGFDELDLIEFMFEQYQQQQQEKQEKQLKSIDISLISLCKSKSIKVFDYLYNKLSLPTIPFNYLLIYSTKFNLIILNHYKKSYSKQFEQSIKSIVSWQINLTEMAFTFIYSNINDFIDYYDSFDIWSFRVSDSNQSFFLYRSFDTYKFFVESTPSNKSYRCYYDSQSVGSDYFQILHWLMNTKKSDIESGRCSFSIDNDSQFSKEPPLLYHYFHGTLESKLSIVSTCFLQNLTHSKLIPLVMEIGKRGDIQSFQFIFDKIDSFIVEGKPSSFPLVIRNTLTKILIKYACQNDRFQLLSYCSKIFTPKQLSKEFIQSESQRNGSIQLAKILKHSFNYTYNYETIENVFLLNYLKKNKI